MPEEGGLGAHLTLDLGGQAKFGPDVEWVDSIDYAVDPARAQTFYQKIRHYWPGLPDGALEPSYSGEASSCYMIDMRSNDMLDAPAGSTCISQAGRGELLFILLL